jgi:MarR family transcriptional regulator for hemolysin
MAPRSVANEAAADDSEEARLSALDERLAKYHRAHADSDADDLYYRATREIVVAGRRWRKLANERIRPTGHTMARWETLFLVAFSDHALTQGELARLLNVEGPTLVRMLDVLSKEGLIDRRQSEIDRRVTTNAITAKGRQAIDDIMSITNSLRAEVLKGLDPKELATALKVLGQIIERIDALR